MLLYPENDAPFDLKFLPAEGRRDRIVQRDKILGIDPAIVLALGQRLLLTALDRQGMGGPGGAGEPDGIARRGSREVQAGQLDFFWGQGNGKAFHALDGTPEGKTVDLPAAGGVETVVVPHRRPIGVGVLGKERKPDEAASFCKFEPLPVQADRRGKVSVQRVLVLNTHLLFRRKIARFCFRGKPPALDPGFDRIGVRLQQNVKDKPFLAEID